MQQASKPVAQVPPTVLPRLLGAALALGLIVAVVQLAHHASAVHASDPATVSWQKQPATISATLTDPAQPFSFDEVMLNQGDPHGLGGFTFTVRYDASVWQTPALDLTPAIDLFSAAGRTLNCSPTSTAPGAAGVVCASTGLYGSGPVWSGPQALAAVTLTLLPNVAAAVISGGGLQSVILDTDVQVTNSCGQPLNDGTIQPIAGQPECQGNLLPGLSGGGVVISPGSTTITIGSPPTMTPTATSSVTGTPTASRSSTVTPVTSMTPSRTTTVHPGSSTPQPGRTASPTATSSTPPGTSTSVRPVGTVTESIATGTSTIPGGARTVVPTATVRPCGFDATTWGAHPETWPLNRLALGREQYNSQELLSLITSRRTDAAALLARELIAAKLNVAAYGDAGGVSQSIALGDDLLLHVGGRLPDVAPSAYESQGMLWIAGVLAGYNNECERVSSVLSSNTSTTGGPHLPRTGVSGVAGAHSWLAVVISTACVLGAVLAALVVRHAWFDQED